MYRETSIPVILVVAVIILRETLVILLVRLIFVFSLSLFFVERFRLYFSSRAISTIFSFLSGSGSFPHALLVFVNIVSYFDGKLLLLVEAYLDFISVKYSSF